jgi:hypothetical protein
MEVRAKGGGWGAVGRMRDVGGLVGRRVGGRFGGVVGAPPKNLGSGVRGKKSDKKTVPRSRKTELGGKKSSWEKNAQKFFIYTDQRNCPLGDSFLPSMKSQNGIFSMV